MLTRSRTSAIASASRTASSIRAASPVTRTSPPVRAHPSSTGNRQTGAGREAIQGRPARARLPPAGRCLREGLRRALRGTRGRANLRPSTALTTSKSPPRGRITKADPLFPSKRCASISARSSAGRRFAQSAKPSLSTRWIVRALCPRSATSSEAKSVNSFSGRHEELLEAAFGSRLVEGRQVQRSTRIFDCVALDHEASAKNRLA